MWGQFCIIFCVFCIFCLSHPESHRSELRHDHLVCVCIMCILYKNVCILWLCGCASVWKNRTAYLYRKNECFRKGETEIDSNIMQHLCRPRHGPVCFSTRPKKVHFPGPCKDSIFSKLYTTPTLVTPSHLQPFWDLGGNPLSTKSYVCQLPDIISYQATCPIARLPDNIYELLQGEVGKSDLDTPTSA